MRAKQAGFSLIELIIVVVILGLLAVTALPRFLDVTEEAEIANIEGMAGGFATGVSLVRAQWEAEGRPTVGSANSVWYDGVRFYLTTENQANSVAPGYPLDTNANPSNSMTVAACGRVWEGLLQNPPSLASTVGAAADNRYFVDVTSGSLCVFYLARTLTKNSAGSLVDPNGSTSVGNNFTYDPDSGRVNVNIN